MHTQTPTSALPHIHMQVPLSQGTFKKNFSLTEFPFVYYFFLKCNELCYQQDKMKKQGIEEGLNHSFPPWDSSFELHHLQVL